MNHFRSFLPLTLSLLTVQFVSGQDLKIYHVDVNQGDATLFVMPNGTSMLIDAGEDYMGDEIARVIKDFADLEHIDVFVASHYHSDHYGGIDKIINNEGIPVVFFYDRDAWSWLPDEKHEQNNFKEYVSVSKVKRKYLKPGYVIDLDPSVSITCYVVNGKIQGGEVPVIGPKNENSHSLGLIISYNGFDYWTSGDVEEDVETALAETGLLPNVDMIKANHHGSATSSTKSFIQALDPEVVIVSNGNHGGFRHPRKTTLDNIESALDNEVTIYQTNKLIKLGIGGGNVLDEFIADLDPAGDEGTILVTVGQDSYEVKFLDRGSTWTFPIEQ